MLEFPHPRPFALMKAKRSQKKPSQKILAAMASAVAFHRPGP